ncbi:TMV resistance protein N-like [Neltuma alba]|uniref:TMV resistance protein N-like n=1 Tax=Neltuma alba TaxID=207710 RepID=UPI0010A3E43B|nr:TMV resistance protein N-like [Prosopis alba]
MVANLSGWDTRNRHEGEIVEDIAKFIWNKLCDKLPSSFEHLVGDVQSKAERIISSLKIGLDDKCFIGIWGMGGIGKTTLARVVYDSIRKKFDTRCFLANVREDSKRVGLVGLQKKLLSCLGLGEPEISDCFQGRDVIRNFLCHKKVLIVLDDVSHRRQLDNLARNKEWFGAGSKIIITTRDIQLLTQYEQFEAYEVGRLSPDESLKLFCQKAFRKDEPNRSYLDLSREVVEYASGLPLALEVLGSFLCRRKQSEWRDTLEKLRQNLHHDIFNQLRISYDGLEDEEYRRMFLDIACFYNGEAKSKVIGILKICGLHPIIGIQASSLNLV